MSTVVRDLDPVTFEVLRNGFVSICNEMSVAVEMSAYSAVISEGRDYSATLYDADGNLVAQGEHDLPSHAGTATFTVRAVIDSIGSGSMREGDAYVMNDPYIGGTHLQDVRVVMPIFHDGAIAGYVATTGHWSDVGGMVPGSFYMEATEIYQEGVQIPPVLVWRDGALNRDVVALLFANMRVAHERRGDLMAQIAACRAGDRLLRETVDRYGRETVAEAMAESQDYSERLLRSEIAKIPDGVWDWEDWIDQDPKTGEPKKVVLRMEIEGDQLSFDFSKSDAPVQSAINSSFPGLCTAVFMTTKALFPQVMLNEGLLRAMNIEAGGDTIVNAPRPFPVGGMAVTAIERAIGTILGAFSEADPARTTANHYNLINIVFGGRYADSEEEFVAYVWTEGGIGARATKDGLNAVMSFFSASTRNIAVEIHERRAPVRWDRYSLRQDSCGAGEHRGGIGSERLLHCEADGIKLSAIGDREKFPPFGIFGGGNASSQHVIRRDKDGNEESLGLFFSNKDLAKGDDVIYLSGGGGAYGPAEKRDAVRIMKDIVFEYISPGFAEKNYGVVIDVVDAEALDYRIDAEKTRAKRRELFGAEYEVIDGLDEAGELTWS